MASTREQRLVRIEQFCVVSHTVFDEAYHLKLWYQRNDNPVVLERLDAWEREMDEAYHKDMAQMEREDAFDDLCRDDRDDEDVDCDVETCVVCGRGYGPHEKEKTWVRYHRSDIMPQRCFRCWDI